MLPVRCFVAVWPSSEVVTALAAIPRPTVPGLRWARPDQWHVTLRFFGHLDQTDVASAVERLRRVASNCGRPLIASGGPASRFLGPGLIVWPVSGLSALAQATETATAELGEPPEGRRFFGHLTIARARRGQDLRGSRHLLSPLAADWDVSTICLVESRLHPDGARYANVVEIPLGSAV